MSNERTDLMAKDADISRAANELLGETGRLPGGGRNVRNISMDTMFNAIEHEGPEVMSKAAKGYWEDMDRLYPHLRRGGGGASRREFVRGGKVMSRSRFGRGTVVRSI